MMAIGNNETKTKINNRKQASKNFLLYGRHGELEIY
jgi:hypothetical protein